MAAFLGEVFSRHYNGLMDVEVWIEPFAGGAGAGLTLLEAEVVSEVWLVERNPALAAFWRCARTQSEALAGLVEHTSPTMAQWERSRALLAAPAEAKDEMDLAMAAFLVNRCSRSGMISPKVGPIGGKRQDGDWSIASRFNGPALAERIRRVGSYPLRVIEGDAIDYVEGLTDCGFEDEVMLFVDPPYVREGNGLYAQGMSLDEHRRLAKALRECPSPWLLTYDDEPVVAQEWYAENPVLEFEIAHTANRQRIDCEYLVLSHNVAIPFDPQVLPTGSCRWLREPDYILSDQPTLTLA